MAALSAALARRRRAPDHGQEFVDQVQRPGWMILFNLLLRIPLAMFGLFLSIAAFEAMIWILSLTFYPAVVAATSSNATGLISWVVMIVMMTYLHWQLAVKSFHLITQVPDRVSRWFGANGEQMNEEQYARESMGFLMTRTESAVSNSVGRAGAGAMAKGGPRIPEPGAGTAVAPTTPSAAVGSRAKSVPAPGGGDPG